MIHLLVMITAGQQTDVVPLSGEAGVGKRRLLDAVSAALPVGSSRLVASAGAPRRTVGGLAARSDAPPYGIHVDTA